MNNVYICVCVVDQQCLFQIIDVMVVLRSRQVSPVQV